MKKKNILLIGSVLLFACSQPKLHYKASIITYENIPIFEDSVLYENGLLYSAEISAVEYFDNIIVIANDKVHPELSPVYTAKLQNHSVTGLQELRAEPYQTARKIEDITIANEFLVFMSSFSHTLDGYSTLLYAPKNDLSKPQLLTYHNPDSLESKDLRLKLQKLLNENGYESNYFKLEGIAAVPNNQLLIGIRESGKAYTDYNYLAAIISVGYTIENNKMYLNSEPIWLNSYNLSSLPEGKHTGLSGLEYDKATNNLYVITSYEISETDEGLGGRLWVTNPGALFRKEALKPVASETDSILLFAHKPEGIAAISEDMLIVFFDDDRILGRELIENPKTQFSRKRNETTYQVLKITTK